MERTIVVKTEFRYHAKIDRSQIVYQQRPSESTDDAQNIVYQIGHGELLKLNLAHDASCTVDAA